MPPLVTPVGTEEHVPQLVMFINLNKGTQERKQFFCVPYYNQQVACLTAVLQSASGFHSEQAWLFELPTMYLSARHYQPCNNDHTLRVVQCSIFSCRQTYFTCKHPLHDCSPAP